MASKRVETEEKFPRRAKVTTPDGPGTVLNYPKVGMVNVLVGGESHVYNADSLTLIPETA